jgi:hypothetical protein
LYKSEVSADYVEKYYMEKIEFCKIIRGANVNGLLQQMMKAALTVKGLDTFCQVKGKVGFYNATIPDSPLTFLWPPGFYRSSIKVYDEFDEKIYYFVIDSIWDGK